MYKWIWTALQIVTMLAFAFCVPPLSERKPSLLVQPPTSPGEPHLVLSPTELLLRFPGEAWPEDQPYGGIDCNNPVFWDAEGNLHLYNSGAGGRLRHTAPALLTMAAGVWPRAAVNDPAIAPPAVDMGGVWFESVVPDPQRPGVVYAFYHEEMPGRLCPMRADHHDVVPRIGMAKSVDNGATFTNLGFILETAPEAIDCNSADTFYDGGNADFTAVLDSASPNQKDWYYYLAFSNHVNHSPAWRREQGTGFARLKYTDRDHPADNQVFLDPNHGPLIQTLSSKAVKWCGSRDPSWCPKGPGWTEPGIGGHITPAPNMETEVPFLTAGQRGFAFHSIHWNTHLNAWVILTKKIIDIDWNTDGSYVVFNYDISDPTQWTKPYRFDPRNDHFPQIIGLRPPSQNFPGETDKLAGCKARLFKKNNSLEIDAQPYVGFSHEDLYFLKPEETFTRQWKADCDSGRLSKK